MRGGPSRTAVLELDPRGPGGMTMLAADAGPFAALGSKQDRYGDRDEWIPFVAVDDVDAATKRAVSLGASLVREKSRGPAGEFTVVAEPIALRRQVRHDAACVCGGAPRTQIAESSR